MKHSPADPPSSSGQYQGFDTVTAAVVAQPVHTDVEHGKKGAGAGVSTFDIGDQQECDTDIIDVGDQAVNFEMPRCVAGDSQPAVPRGPHVAPTVPAACCVRCMGRGGDHVRVV